MIENNEKLPYLILFRPVMKNEPIAKKDQIGCPETLFNVIVHQFLHPLTNYPLFQNQCLR